MQAPAPWLEAALAAVLAGSPSRGGADATLIRLVDAGWGELTFPPAARPSDRDAGSGAGEATLSREATVSREVFEACVHAAVSAGASPRFLTSLARVPGCTSRARDDLVSARLPLVAEVVLHHPDISPAQAVAAVQILPVESVGVLLRGLSASPSSPRALSDSALEALLHRAPGEIDRPTFRLLTTTRPGVFEAVLSGLLDDLLRTCEGTGSASVPAGPLQFLKFALQDEFFVPVTLQRLPVRLLDRLHPLPVRVQEQMRGDLENLGGDPACWQALMVCSEEFAGTWSEFLLLVAQMRSTSSATLSITANPKESACLQPNVLA